MIDRDRFRSQLEQLDGETFSLLDLLGSQPDVTVAGWREFLRKELRLDSVDPEGMLFDRVRVITRLLGTHDGGGDATPDISRLRVNTVSLIRRSCRACGLVHWRLEAAPLTCPRCQAPIEQPTTPMTLAWSPHIQAFIPEEGK